jgi:hypothetical protein
MASYTQSERKEILDSRKSDESIKELSIRTGVSTTSLYQWLKDIEIGNSVLFAPLQVNNPPDEAIETIRIIYENFKIQLPVHTDASYIRSILGC